MFEKLIKTLEEFKEKLEKRAPKGVDPDKHESCVKDVKKQGHDVGSAHAICTSSMKKDEIDEKIKAKIKAEMDKRNFTEADATKHIIDRDRGEKIAKEPKPPKQKPLMQSEQEMCKFNEHGQWNIEKSNYGPKQMKLYRPVDNQERKSNNTGDVVPNAGKNVNVKSWTTTGSAMSQAHEANQAKEQREKTIASTRTFADMSEEEKEAMRTLYGKK